VCVFHLFSVFVSFFVALLHVSAFIYVFLLHLFSVLFGFFENDLHLCGHFASLLCSCFISLFSFCTYSHFPVCDCFVLGSFFVAFHYFLS